jgi:UDP-N-acetylmuramoyl-tripeptide--D-alanyl-D-alanine ligase
MIHRVIYLILALSPMAGCFFASRGLIHYFQLESYQFPGYFHTLRRNWKRSYLPGAGVAVLTFSLLAMHDRLVQSAGGTVVELLIACAVLILSCAGGLWIGKLFQDKMAKKPLVFTARIKRLYAVYAASLILLAVVLWQYVPVVVLLAAVPLIMPYLLAMAGLIAWPVEKIISEMYFRDAQRKLREMPGLIRIGITGSYGKTSVKFFLGTMLAEKFNVLVTPSSFNTPMGVTRIIREKLQPGHQVFVAEMGARHKGDIKEMCRLVHPTLGILTSVGPQHLDTFKTLETVIRTKYELIDALPEGGHGFFADDGDICFKLYEKTQKPKMLVSLRRGNCDVWASGIASTPEGSTFTLHEKGGESIACTAKLLGQHNIQNILLAAAVCLQLGLSLTQIARGIAKLEPVEHRLQLIQSGGLTIIDDAFNSNPQGAMAAIRVLKEFQGRRVIITPGMVELGDKEEQFNQEFGKAMASCVDVAILVGKKHTLPIFRGLKGAGFPENAIHPVSSLAEATSLLHSLARTGDVVLFENDLPDNYSEV